MTDEVVVAEPIKTGFKMAGGAFLFSIALVVGAAALAGVAGVVLSSRTGN
tara:strand:- start:1240 stop:1389 length:150 start_codon:yes stop_codon:yes gene_type:complete